MFFISRTQVLLVMRHVQCGRQTTGHWLLSVFFMLFNLRWTCCIMAITNNTNVMLYWNGYLRLPQSCFNASWQFLKRWKLVVHLLAKQKQLQATCQSKLDSQLLPKTVAEVRGEIWPTQVVHVTKRSHRRDEDCRAPHVSCCLSACKYLSNFFFVCLLFSFFLCVCQF